MEHKILQNMQEKEKKWVVLNDMGNDLTQLRKKQLVLRSGINELNTTIEQNNQELEQPNKSQNISKGS